MKKFSFHKKYRISKTLKSNFKNYNYLSKKKNISLFCTKNSLNFSRLGIIISKKKIRKSYKRNLLKRIIRESFRHMKNKILKMDFLIIINRKIKYIDKKKYKNFLYKIWLCNLNK
ncbi:ribonuclease P protein component [Buchnera aphidicola (Taiwanaphis decaspermi)]|uniref:ribonuclease P protein component n=1 Tax=Buchnera aphidicola TaxID=9 RepID=UPI0031B7EB3C